MKLCTYWDKLCDIHDAIHKSRELQIRILQELREFRKMADTRLSNIDAELDQEDQALSQLEQDGKDILSQRDGYLQQIKDLQAKLDAGNGTLDDQAEVIRMQGEVQRLNNMHASIQAALNPAPSTGALDPNTGNVTGVTDGSTNTMLPTSVSASGSGPSPATGQPSVSPDENLNNGPGAGSNVANQGNPQVDTSTAPANDANTTDSTQPADPATNPGG